MILQSRCVVDSKVFFLNHHFLPKMITEVSQKTGSYFQRRCDGPKMSRKEFHILCKNRCGDYLGLSDVYCQMILIFCVRIDVENIEEYPM